MFGSKIYSDCLRVLHTHPWLYSAEIAPIIGVKNPKRVGVALKRMYSEGILLRETEGRFVEYKRQVGWVRRVFVYAIKPYETKAQFMPPVAMPTIRDRVFQVLFDLGGSVTQREIMDRLTGVDIPSVSRALGRMVRDGIVHAEIDERYIPHKSFKGGYRRKVKIYTLIQGGTN